MQCTCDFFSILLIIICPTLHLIRIQVVWLERINYTLIFCLVSSIFHVLLFVMHGGLIHSIILCLEVDCEIQIFIHLFGGFLAVSNANTWIKFITHDYLDWHMLCWSKTGTFTFFNLFEINCHFMWVFLSIVPSAIVYVMCLTVKSKFFNQTVVVFCPGNNVPLTSITLFCGKPTA